MISYLLLIVVVQTSLLAKILCDATENRKKIRRRIMRIEEILPQIEEHPNPKLGDLLWRLGTDMRMDDDAPSRMLGACLVSYQAVLRQEVSRKQLYEKKMIKLLQDTMVKLKQAFQQDSGEKLAQFALDMSRILFEYPKVEEDPKISKKLEGTLLTCIEYLKNTESVDRSASELDLFAKWNFQNLRKSDAYLRFIFIHLIRWVSQLPFEYPIATKKFHEKAEELADSIQKILLTAKRKDHFCMYQLLSCLYVSLFPKTEPFVRMPWYRPRSLLLS